VFEKYDFIQEDENSISVAEDIFNRGVCLPSDTKMSNEDLQRVINIVKEFYNV
jgi:dTDP-4-amino-4,6-dideoxygalactose transaminase